MNKEDLKLDDKEIKSIGWWYEPDFHSLVVGEQGITAIDCAEQFCGEYTIHWIQVWSNDKLISRYNARNVDTIHYF